MITYMKNCGHRICMCLEVKWLWLNNQLMSMQQLGHFMHSHLHAVRLNNNMASNLSNLGVNPPLPPYILKGGGCQALPFIIPDL